MLATMRPDGDDARQARDDASGDDADCVDRIGGGIKNTS